MLQTHTSKYKRSSTRPKLSWFVVTQEGDFLKRGGVVSFLRTAVGVYFGTFADLNPCRNRQHKTMESLLQRGEKLDDLVARSDALSAQSKLFYKTAKWVS